MAKSFVNLSAKYKQLLDQITTLITDKDKTAITNEKISFRRINDIYQSINNILSNNLCDEFDINNLLNNYSKQNEIIEQLRSIMKIRNKIILNNAMNSTFWKTNINNIMAKCNKIFTNKCKYELIEEAFNELLKKYENNWMGYWTTIDINKLGVIKNIGILDIDDNDYILLFIAKKCKWQIKDENVLNRLKAL